MLCTFPEEPTHDSYECRPYKTGNSESCKFSGGTLRCGTWHVMLNTYADYTNLKIKVGDGPAGKLKKNSNRDKFCSFRLD